MKRMLWIGLFVIAGLVAGVYVLADGDSRGAARLRNASSINSAQSIAGGAPGEGGAPGISPTNAARRNGEETSVSSNAGPVEPPRIRQMSPESESLIEDFREEAALESDEAAILLDRLRSEAPDPVWSPRTEQLLDSALHMQGNSLFGITSARPKCVKSLCALGLEGGSESDGPGVDVQRSLAEVSSEQWFQDNFKDSALSMGVKDGRIVYSIYLVRKD